MIKLTDLLLEILNEKKADRCKRIADRRYSKPSAYKSGAIVRCRKGKIWKGIKENISAEEATNSKGSLQTVIDGKRDLGFEILTNLTNISNKEFLKLIKQHNLKILKIPSNPYKAIIFYKPGAEEKAKELRDIAEKYGGFLSWEATEEDSRRIGQLLGYKEEDIESYIKHNKELSQKKEAFFVSEDEPILNEKQKETLRTWFKRKGAPGKTGGWVDCNTCREVDGKKKCKPCGRQKGEKRAKYPSCRPTPSQCSQPGKGKKWGKTK